MTLPWIKDATSGFVNADEMREAVSLALAAGRNLIFSGPGGHGKSEFLTAAFGAIGDTAPYVKSFGQGTSAEELYGGLDFNALNPQSSGDKAVLQYCPELSFLEYRIAVFEELFDAPARMLTSLKDTLTARELRNGHQRHTMQTSIIAAATNHSPTEIAEGGPEIAALIERFPIQLKVEWSNYNEDSFLELFTVVTSERPAFEQVSWSDVAALQERALHATMSNMMKRMLAKIIVELRRDKVVISPRTAVVAMQIAKAAAAKWYGYSDLPLLGYEHESHNHSVGDYADTNEAENIWSVSKRHMRKLYGGRLLTNHLEDFCREWMARANRPELFHSPAAYLRFTFVPG